MKHVLLVCICCFTTDMVHIKLCEISVNHTHRSVASKMCRYFSMLQSHIVSESSDSTLWYLWGGEWRGELVCHSQQCNITWSHITWHSLMNCNMLTCALLDMFPRCCTLLECSFPQEVSDLLQYLWHMCFIWTSIIHISQKVWSITLCLWCYGLVWQQHFWLAPMSSTDLLTPRLMPKC